MAQLLAILTCDLLIVDVIMLNGTISRKGLTPCELQTARLLRVDTQILGLLWHLLHDKLYGHLILQKAAAEGEEEEKEGEQHTAPKLSQIAIN